MLVYGESDMRGVTASIIDFFSFLGYCICCRLVVTTGLLTSSIRIVQVCNIIYVHRLMLCFLICQCSDYSGLSLELGSFLAGVMISTTDFAHHTLEQVVFCIPLTLYFYATISLYWESTVFLFVSSFI